MTFGNLFMRVGGLTIVSALGVGADGPDDVEDGKRVLFAED